MKWQPIESAPTDGTRVLVFDPAAEEKITIDYYGYVTKDSDGWPTYGWDGSPTHWISLPEPPPRSKP